MRDRVKTDHAKLARLMDWRKSAPFISTEMHISARRERMRSPMRSPRVCSRAARSRGADNKQDARFWGEFYTYFAMKLMD